MQYTYTAHVISVYDGDTIRVDIDLGFGVWLHNQTLRLYGINAPEVRGKERPAGLRTRDALRAKINGKQIKIRTHKDKKGKYGRWLADVFFDSEHLNTWLIVEGLAKAKSYD